MHFSELYVCVFEELSYSSERITLYKVTINKYLCDFTYPLPLIDEMLASLQGVELFSKLDISNAYNQLILDGDSLQLCT